jgi:hypothetical protein
MERDFFTGKDPTSSQIVATYLKQALFGLVAEQATPEALRAEAIRVSLWELSILTQPPTIAEASISTQRILGRARMLYEPCVASQLQVSTEPNAASEDLTEDELSRQALDELAEQGDLLSLPQGRWLSAPLRLVPITAELYLLVGGLPCSLLASKVLQKLRLHGSFRQIEAEVIQTCTPFDGHDEHWQFQTLESWLGAPAPTLEQLYRKFQEQERELQPITVPHQFEAYVASLNNPQRLRWTSLERASKNGLYLLRSQTRWGQTRYSVGVIEDHQIKRVSSFLEAWDIRRLCYALDAAAQTPTSVTWDRSQGRLTLRSELPARERKRLATLGTLQKNRGNYYPRIWHIDRRHEQEVQKLLADLAVMIQ